MNILTIDFDWIMSPIIEAYNNIIDEDDYSTREQNWEEIYLRLPTLSFFPDLNLYTNIWEICERYSHCLYKINSHEEVIKYLPDNIETLINIDHHHDWYSEENFVKVPNCADWAQYLWQRQKIKQYIWICNPTSREQLPANKNLIKWEQDPFIILHKYSIDKVILCKSEYWLSNEAIKLWDILIKQFDFLNKE